MEPIGYIPPAEAEQRYYLQLAQQAQHVAPGFARVAYAETLSARALDYVTAQQALGAPTSRILARTLLPNIAPPLIVQFSLTVASATLLESGLSFLGLGVQEPLTSWGLLIAEGAGAIEASPWLLLYPSLLFVITLSALNFFGDGLRDAFDPRER